MSQRRLLIVLILLIATFLRFHRLPDLPPGLNFDEAGNGVAAAEILAGAPRLWWRIGGGKEPVWPYLTALGTVLWGNNPLTLRLLAAMVGVLSVAALYPLTIALFRGRYAFVIAALAMLGLATSAWHLHFSRLGFRAILLPLLSSLAFYCFWSGLTAAARQAVPDNRPFWRVSRRDSCFMWAAFYLALAVYSYLGARLLPVVPIVFAVLQWSRDRLLVWWFRRGGFPESRHGTDTAETNPNENLHQTGSVPQGEAASLFFSLGKLLIYLGLFLSPLIVYFLLNPQDFAARATTVSIFNPAWHKGDLAGTAWRTLTLTAGTYLGLRGDANPLVNLPDQPALPLILVPFFVTGIVASLVELFHPIFAGVWRADLRSTRLRISPHLFLLCWWGIMLLPALLAPEGAPHHLRLIGTIGPTYILVATGFVTLAALLVRLLSFAGISVVRSLPRRKQVSRIAGLLAVVCFTLIGLRTYTNYFKWWPNSVDFTLPLDLYAVRLASSISDAPEDVAYIIPMDIRAGDEARHYTLDYLVSPRRSGAYTYIPVDERNTESLLARAAAGRDELRLVRWTGDKHLEADAKEIVTLLLATTTRSVGLESFPVYEVETYSLEQLDEPDCATNPKIGGSGKCGRPDQPFELPPIDQPVQAEFEGLLRLEAAYVAPKIDPTYRGLVAAVTLAPLAPMDVDYKASVRLLGPAGERVAQKDRVLAHEFHQGTSLWPPETVNEYYLLSVPADVPAGEYTVVMVIYHPDTQAALTAGGAIEVPLGTVQIE
jgi:hypothetical protein